jgi:23S rRNA (adenine-N6)-dimethyltransferase
VSASFAARRRWWGWHQLSDDWARRLVQAAHVGPGDLVLDVGAGTGAITAPLVRAGARVVAVELHPERAQVLRERFAGDAVTVVEADATDLRLPRRPFRVVANPPFAVTTALLRRLLGPHSLLTTAVLVLPRHATVRWASGRGAGAARWQWTFDARVTNRLPATAFVPPAPGATAVLRLQRRHMVGG